MQFDKLQLHENLLKGIIDAGYSNCMPVQAETFVSTLKGRDVYVQSQTGTGKTAAFLVTIFQRMAHEPQGSRSKALIVAPTRELAVQIENEAHLLGRYLDVQVGCFYGGVSYTKQEKLLQGGVDILIGTPGRLIDFQQQGKINFRKIDILVIDEADRLFDMGFLPDLRKILKKMPPREKRLTMLFSATLDYRVRELAWEYMNDPDEIEIEAEQVTVDKISQELYHVGAEEKMRLLLGLLQKYRPENALIFTNTKHMAVEVAKRLELNGYPCEYIMGDLPQSQRLKVIEGIKNNEIRFLVATDVAARGLHINDLAMVVNYDLPADPENYVHRIGRTARAGKTGKAVSLACDRFVYGLEAIEAYIKMKLPVTWPEEELFAEDASAGQRLGIERKPRSGDRRDRGGRSRRSDGKNDRNKSRGQTRAQTRDTKERTPRNKTAAGKKPGGGQTARPKSLSEMTDQQRREYYRRKYGESFDPQNRKKAPKPPAPKKPGQPKASGKPRKPQRPTSAPPAQRKPPVTAEYSAGKKSLLKKIKGLFGG